MTVLLAFVEVVMRGAGIGVVLKAGAQSKAKAGDFVSGIFGACGF